MNETGNFVKEQLPRYFQSDFPRFIKFLEGYYQWLYKNGGFNQDQVELLKKESDMIKRDIDRFVATGSPRFLDGDLNQKLAEIEISNYEPPGTKSNLLHDRYVGERIFDFFETADGDTFNTFDGVTLDTVNVDRDIEDSWFNSLGFSTIQRDTSIGSFDSLLLVRLLKHIGAIKGTKKSIQLFFEIFFGEVVNIYLPKFDVCVIDENFNPDTRKKLRDDDMYQEYSYVIYVKNDPSFYQDLYESIFLKYVHPGGFKPFLKKEI